MMEQRHSYERQQPLVKSLAKQKLDSEIPVVRKAAGLPPMRSGTRDCLRCEIQFISEDLFNQKCCAYCRREKGD